MPDEEIDKLVRDAANQHHPPYDDTAWGKMEVLLDKHLQQKKDRRRPVIFLLCFLLLGGAVFYGVENSKNNNPGTLAANTTEQKASGADNGVVVTTTNPGSNTAVATDSDSKAPGHQLNPALPSSTDANTGKSIPNGIDQTQSNTGNGDGQYAKSKINSYNQKGRTAVKIKQPVAASDNDNLQEQTNETEKNDGGSNTTIKTAAPKTNDVTATADAAKTAIAQEEKVAKADSSHKPNPAAEKNTTASNNSSATKKKSNKGFGDKFAITLSAGADMSFIDIQNAGKTKPAYGAGVSYAVGKHITVNSGVYFSKKIYTAAPYQYKFTGYVNPGLTNINADCKVIEIPVSVYYNFKQVKNHNWLAGISLSSLLMKRETYDYNYQTSSGQPYSYEKTISNENKHYFSVLTLSGGYQYKLNNHLSLIAEPYLKVPLTGIGLGKIKLNSTGILVTAAIKPFAKKKK